MIGIIDYGLGNLASVRNAFEHLGHEARLYAMPDEAVACDRLVLPGVGSFRAGMSALEERGWTVALRDLIAEGRPLLGICLGMQLLFDTGEEHGPSTGLGLIPGKVIRLAPSEPHKVPHVGWNALPQIRRHPLLDGIRPHVDFYFVHSYHCIPASQDDVIAFCDFGGPFVAAAARGNVAGMQFHPEKSQPAGMRILENFTTWDGRC
jgi:imidazole glycerol-phosphate synthase subunit HisH